MDSEARCIRVYLTDSQLRDARILAIKRKLSPPLMLGQFIVAGLRQALAQDQEPTNSQD